MAKCPECGEEISHLQVKAKDYGMLSINVDGNLILEWNSEVYGSNLDFEFKCPECGATIFYDFEEAEDFLKPKAKQTTLT